MSQDRENLLAVFIENRAALQSYLVRQFGSVNLAEDITQETWLRVASRKLSEHIGNPRAYVFRIAKNLGTDIRRRQAMGIEVQAEQEIVEQVPAHGIDPARSAQFNNELQRLVQVVAHLPPRCRHIFILCRVEGLNHQEIAEQLNISKSTVVSQMVKAMQRIEQAME